MFSWGSGGQVVRLRSFDCAGAACATYMCVRILFSSGRGLAGVHGLSGGVGCNGKRGRKQFLESVYYLPVIIIIMIMIIIIIMMIITIIT